MPRRMFTLYTVCYGIRGEHKRRLFGRVDGCRGYSLRGIAHSYHHRFSALPDIEPRCTIGDVFLPCAASSGLPGIYTGQQRSYRLPAGARRPQPERTAAARWTATGQGGFP